MKIADNDIFTIETGYISLDGGAMFGVVPKTLWQKNNPADEFNRIKLALRLLVIRNTKRLIIVDTGVGNKLNEKLSKIYNVNHTQYDLKPALNKHNIDIEDVTDVILTHLHFDHVGGATYYDNGKLKLTFPNAVHHIQGEQWHWANNPSEKDKASYMPENFVPILEQAKLNELPGPGTLYAGIDLLVMYGHTHGMQLPKISDGKNTLFFCGDLMPTASHIPLPYIMGYDNNPMT
ncbi:MAG: MBL fold metallo-hydrolase, partial [Calditrichaceae bacterium]